MSLSTTYMYLGLYIEGSIFCPILFESEFSWDFCYSSDIKFHENLVGAELIHAGRWTDIHAGRWTDMTKFTATSHDYSNASKMP